MTELEVPTSPTRRDISRRSVLKSAAWAAPVVAATVATPLASASVADAELEWQDDSGFLLGVGLLNGGLLDANVLVSGPEGFTITNPTAGAVEGPLTGTIAIRHVSGIGVLETAGFAVSSVFGIPIDPAARTLTAHYVGAGWTYESTQSFIIPNSVAGNATLDVPVQFAMTKSSVGLGLLLQFRAELTISDANGEPVGSIATAALRAGVSLDLFG